MKEILVSYNTFEKSGIQTVQATNLEIADFLDTICITNGTRSCLHMPKNEKNLEWMGRILRNIYAFMVDPYENFMHIHLVDDRYVNIKRGKRADTYYLVNVEK